MENLKFTKKSIEKLVVVFPVLLQHSCVTSSEMDEFLKSVSETPEQYLLNSVTSLQDAVTELRKQVAEHQQVRSYPSAFLY